MMKRKIQHKILAAFLIIIFAGLLLIYIQSKSAEQRKISIETLTGWIMINTDLASTPEEWARGLMFRNYLNENSGMLFIFPDEQQRTFWMKNTLIQLDMIFVSSSMQIIDIKENFQPCRSDPCETYTSKMPAKYVVEVNEGFVRKNGIGIGNIVRIS